MKKIIALIIVAQLLDYITFIAAVNICGMKGELNPIVKMVGLEGTGILKVIGILLISLILLKLKVRGTEKLVAFGVVFSISIGLVGAFTNIAAITLSG